MSDYLQVQDVIDHLTTLSEDSLYYDNNISGQNTNWIQEDIDCAESDIDSYLGKYYDLPATSVDNPTSFAIFKCITMDITIYRAYLRAACGMPEEIMFAFEQSMKKLKDFRDEKAYLPDVSLSSSSDVGRTEIFTNDAMLTVAKTNLFY